MQSFGFCYVNLVSSCFFIKKIFISATQIYLKNFFICCIQMEWKSFFDKCGLNEDLSNEYSDIFLKNR